MTKKHTRFISGLCAAAMALTAAVFPVGDSGAALLDTGITASADEVKTVAKPELICTVNTMHKATETADTNGDGQNDLSDLARLKQNIPGRNAPMG